MSETTQKQPMIIPEHLEEDFKRIVSELRETSIFANDNELVIDGNGNFYKIKSREKLTPYQVLQSLEKLRTMINNSYSLLCNVR